MKIIKKILSVVGVLALLLVGISMLLDDPSDKSGNSKNGTYKAVDEDDEYYYTLSLENGEEATILIPQTMFEEMYKNMSSQREESIFSSIYNYNYTDDVYVTYIPDAEQTCRDMLKEPYAVGTLFNFTVELTGGVADTGRVSGYIQGDDSVGLIYIDMSYIGSEQDEIMKGDIYSFDVVYAGLDIYSDPTFIALKME